MKPFIFSLPLLMALALAGGKCLHAQDSNEDSFYHHEISFQANRILDEIISLNGSSTFNPYDFRYAYRFNKRDVLTLGLGVNYSTTNDGEWDVLTGLNSDFRLRVGYQRRIDLGYGMELGLGWDAVTRRSRFRNRNINVMDPVAGVQDSTVSDLAENSNYFGTGPRLAFNYQITPRFLVGTEVSFYYFFWEERRTSTSSVSYSNSGDGYELNSWEGSNSRTVGSSFNFSVPTAVYLILRL